jgi:amino acid adenylation domain-containing protein
LFEAQAAARPDAVALVFEDQHLSYGELNRRANRVAHALLALGVRPDDRIAICVERSFEMVTGLLGVLKAGAAYVPLDPAYPAQRLARMLDDSAPMAVLTQASLRPALPPVARPLPVLLLDDMAPQPESNPDPLTLGLTSRHLAYVIYTSGSTGLPKGAMNQHDGVVNRLLWAQSEYRLGHEDRVLQKTPYSFDVSVWEFFLPLLAGAQLVIARPGGQQDPHYLAELIERAQITMLHFVPSMLSTFLDHARMGDTSSLRRVLCSGEALPYSLQAQFGQRLPAVELHNLYGPTEAAVDVTSWRCCMKAQDTAVPIGRPIANTRIYLLDRHLQPVPYGVAGELHIGGVAVGRGYLNRPELTAERFIADPFSNEPHARLYKTGDLASYGADGVIKYLGRNDFQVKIRGLRIELGEIAGKLGAVSGVREAVVIAREDSAGDQRLVAYFTAEHGNELSAAELRNSLLAELPEYMVPAAFVHLDVLPVTLNGKLDRRALPTPDQAALVSHSYEAPQGEAESIMAAIWQDLLKVERVGRQDHFFELGGHSLLAVQLAARVHQKLCMPAPLRILFAYSKLHQFVAALQKAKSTSLHPNLVPIRTEGNARPLFLIHPGLGEVGYVRKLVPWIDANIPVYGLSASGFLPGEAPASTIEEMARVYIEALREVQANGPYRVAGWSLGGTIAYEMAAQLIGAGQDVEFLGLIDTSHHYDPAERNSVARDSMATIVSWLKRGLSSADSTELERLAREDDMESMIALAHAAGTVPAGIERRHLMVYAALSNAAISYSPRKLAIPVDLFSADEADRPDSTLGWGAFLKDQLHITVVGGTHMSIVEDPIAEALGSALSCSLAKVSEEADGGLTMPR